MVRRTTRKLRSGSKRLRQRGGALTAHLLRRVLHKMASELPLPDNSNSEEEESVHSTYRALARRLSEPQARDYLDNRITLEDLLDMPANRNESPNRRRRNRH
jgi:hypothetical protein